MLSFALTAQTAGFAGAEISSLAADNSAIKLSGGWYEEGFAEWDAGVIGDTKGVEYKEAGTTEWQKVDAELINGSRVDIPGLKGNTKYDIKVTGSKSNAVCEVTTMKYDRSGYAHWNNPGVGAYNDDGTLKDGVQIIYVTNENKDTITYNKKTGLYSIFSDGKPQNVVFRFIGDIDVPKGAIANDGKQNDGSGMLYLEDCKNVTVEGIGTSAHLVRWGFEMKRANNVEVRNVYFYQYPDDACSVTGGSTSDGYSRHVWIHNNDFGIGKNEFAGNGTVDADKADGDGSTDIKRSEFVTISYNHYMDCHKCSLIGPNASTYQDWITLHHNWYDKTQSRQPRVRISHVHVYNNYYTDNKEYGIGASYNSKVFSEANYFDGTYLPLDSVAMGKDKYSGTIKSFGDKLVNCSGKNAYAAASSRDEKVEMDNLVSGGDASDNFDTDNTKINSNYNVTSADDAKAEVTAYSGRMKKQSYGGKNTQPETIVTTAAAETTVTTTTTIAKTTTKAPDTTTTKAETTTKAPDTTTTKAETTTNAPETTTTTLETTATQPLETVSQGDFEPNYGDVNLDGQRNISDVVLVGKSISGGVSLTKSSKTNADLFDDDLVTSQDMVLILRLLVNSVKMADLPIKP